MEIENKIKCVLIDFEQGEITLSEATNTILRLFNVSGRSELLESFVKFVNERQFNQFQICLDEVELFLDSN